MSRPPLVLASTSPYRAELLGRLGLPFETETPGTDETPFPDETPGALAIRLAEAKARAAAQWRPEAMVLGSDQCVDLDGTILGKPGDFESARDQLRRLSGRTAVFRTGICVLGPGGQLVGSEEVAFTVAFRKLDEAQIRSYLEREAALDCAGAIRSEGLAPALMERTEGPDATALMGLPLIRTTRLLETAGLSVL